MSMSPFVVFSVETGEPLRWGTCQLELVSAQAGEGEKSLPTNELTVEGNKEPIWQQVRALRAQKIAQGANTPVGVVDSNDEARSNVSGAALAALIAKNMGAPYSVTWTLHDNSTVTLDADGMIGLGLALMAYVDACHTNARNLRSAIEGCTSMAQLLAIDIEEGWPG